MELLYITLFTVIFSTFDYFMYNEFNKRGLTDGIFAPYRIFQTSFQVILIGIAWYFFGWKVAVGFTILWWTWACDFIFHLFCYTNLYNDKYVVTKGDPRAIKYWNESITWAWWTPYGLVDLAINGMPFHQFRVIKWQVLAFQSFIGILLTIYIVLFIGKL